MTEQFFSLKSFSNLFRAVPCKISDSPRRKKSCEIYGPSFHWNCTKKENDPPDLFCAMFFFFLGKGKVLCLPWGKNVDAIGLSRRIANFLWLSLCLSLSRSYKWSCQRYLSTNTERERFFISFSVTLRGQKEKKTSFVSLLSTWKKGEKEKEAQTH